jgi:CBS domain-containing protein
MKVGDIMTRHVEFVEPEATVQETAALMGELDVSALPVGSARALEGVITHRDSLYRLVAEGRDPRRTKVLQIATRLVFTCRDSDAIQVAIDLMAAQSIRRLPVVDDAGRVAGWLTLSDISRRLLVDSDVVQQALRELTDPVGESRQSATR